MSIRGDTARDAIAGAAGGIVSVLLGQPFDLIKVRLQTQNSSNVFKVVSDILKYEGALAFYKGALLPFLGSGASVSIQFSVFHKTLQALGSLNPRLSDLSQQRPSKAQFYLAGGAAGIANSIVSGPVEHIRIRLQIQPNGTARLYTGPWDCIKQIVSKAGLVGLYRGQPVSMVREFQAFGLYFATFEACSRMIAEARQEKREQLSTWIIAPCGAFAGVAFWVGSYPIDVIKTKLQSDGVGSEKRHRNAWAATVETWESAGLRGFFRGLGPTFIRTILSSAGTFVM
ncbi:MC family mitochondrial carrier protein [Tricladium varicosporioides]|nr:MC family mitochondrial carrier protein [Hymenoscyphus varicosporioides]